MLNLLSIICPVLIGSGIGFIYGILFKQMHMARLQSMAGQKISLKNSLIIIAYTIARLSLLALLWMFLLLHIQLMQFILILVSFFGVYWLVIFKKSAAKNANIDTVKNTV